MTDVFQELAFLEHKPARIRSCFSWGVGLLVRAPPQKKIERRTQNRVKLVWLAGHGYHTKEIRIVSKVIDVLGDHNG